MQEKEQQLTELQTQLAAARSAQTDINDLQKKNETKELTVSRNLVAALQSNVKKLEDTNTVCELG